MTGWRCAAILGNAEAIQTYWRLKTNVDSGLFEAVQLAGAAALRGPARAAGADERDLRPPPRPRRRAPCARSASRSTPPKGTIYVWAPVPEGHTSTSFAELVLEEAAVVVSPGSMYGPSGEGFFRISLTTPDERIERGGRADARAPGLGARSRSAALAPVAVEAAPLVGGGDGLEQLGGGLRRRCPSRRRWARQALAASASYSSEASRASSASSRRRSPHRLEVRGRVLDRAEVGEGEALGRPACDDVDRFLPGLDVDVGGRGRGDDQVRGRDAAGGDVADEGGAALLVQVADVVGGVAGRVGDAHPEHRLAAGEGAARSPRAPARSRPRGRSIWSP